MLGIQVPSQNRISRPILSYLCYYNRMRVWCLKCWIDSTKHKTFSNSLIRVWFLGFWVWNGLYLHCNPLCGANSIFTHFLKSALRSPFFGGKKFKSQNWGWERSRPNYNLFTSATISGFSGRFERDLLLYQAFLWFCGNQFGEKSKF